MSDVAVVIPFESAERWRARARDHVTGRYRAAGLDVVEGHCPGPWRKAVAVADALTQTTAALLVVADADCLCDGVPQALEAVRAGAPWAVPHDLVHRLDETATSAVYADTPPAGTLGRAQRPYRGFAGGGITVIPRALYERVPLDPRFAGWGSEDSSWALALTTLAGEPWRGSADLYHLWHPPAPRMSRRWGTPAARALEIRYRHAARQGRRAMTDLLDEARMVTA